MPGGSRKGSPFERAVCKQLSLWWSGGGADDLFWRSSASGARATVRGKKGKTTTGHGGDIACTSSAGQPLTDLIALELKRGYARATVADLLDRPEAAKEQAYEEWIRQAENSAFNSLVPYWLLLHKRDRREAVCFYPTLLYHRLRAAGAGLVPSAQFAFGPSVRCRSVCCSPWADFLESVTPGQVRAVLVDLKRRRA
jgi:hypothetical protein